MSSQDLLEAFKLWRFNKGADCTRKYFGARRFLAVSPPTLNRAFPDAILMQPAAKPSAYNLYHESLKSAALVALVGMILLTVVVAFGFIRDVSALASGAIAANSILVSLIHLLASLSVTVFLYVFHSRQS